MGGGDNFQQPNISEDQEVGRNARRHLRQQTAILTWLHTFSPETLLSTSLYERVGSDRVLPTDDPHHAAFHRLRARRLPWASRAIFPTTGAATSSRPVWTWFACEKTKASSSIAAAIPTCSPASVEGCCGGQASALLQDHFSPVRNLTAGPWSSLRLLRPGGYGRADQPARRPGVPLPKDQVSPARRLQPLFLARRPSNIPCWPALSATMRSIRTSGSATCAPTPRTMSKWDGRRNCDPRVSLELNAYLHTGHNSFENHEISIAASSFL